MTPHNTHKHELKHPLAAVATIAVGLLVAGCGGSATNTATTSHAAPQTPPTPAAPTPPPTGAGKPSPPTPQPAAAFPRAAAVTATATTAAAPATATGTFRPGARCEPRVSHIVGGRSCGCNPARGRPGCGHGFQRAARTSAATLRWRSD